MIDYTHKSFDLVKSGQRSFKKNYIIFEIQERVYNLTHLSNKNIRHNQERNQIYKSNHNHNIHPQQHFKTIKDLCRNLLYLSQMQIIIQLICRNRLNVALQLTCFDTNGQFLVL